MIGNQRKGFKGDPAERSDHGWTNKIDNALEIRRAIPDLAASGLAIRVRSRPWAAHHGACDKYVITFQIDRIKQLLKIVARLISIERTPCAIGAGATRSFAYKQYLRSEVAVQLAQHVGLVGQVRANATSLGLNTQGPETGCFGQNLARVCYNHCFNSSIYNFAYIMSQLSEEIVLNSLRQIIDPDLKKDIVKLGFVRDLKIDGGNVAFRIVLTTPACPVKEEMETQATDLVRGLEGVTNVKVTMDAEVPQGRGVANNIAIPGVKNIIAVSSGKGGVGKSTVAVNLAVALAADGAKVGLMDADVYGPNVPMMLGTSYDQPEIVGGQLRPVEAHGIKMISMALLVPPDKPMILRGPMLHGVVRQFLSDVNWGELDYLIVDMPPGTGDVQLSLAQLVPVQGAVVVTTPQEVSLSDGRRAIQMLETDRPR